MVVSYYWRPAFPKSAQLCTWLALQMLAESSGIRTIILVDGSPGPDSFIKGVCQNLGVNYLHAGKELSFSEGFNLGWKTLSEPYVGLMANDVFPSRSSIQTLLKWIEIPDVGCVFPYLTYCDYPGQTASYVRKQMTCEPSAMTINLNLLKRSVLEAVGGVDEAYSGAYNDMILILKIRKLGFRVVQVHNTLVTHMGTLTISQGANFKKEADVGRFSKEYGDYCAKHGIWKIKHWKWPLASGPTVSILWWISQNAPGTRIRSHLQRFTMSREPELTRYPALWGKSKPF
jgi:GT2 family glycosyltransferase